MERDFIYNFIRQNKYAVISSIANNLKPEAALIGIAVSEDLEIIFDTVNTSRKYANILSNPKVALVIGWNDARTLQYEGEAMELTEPSDDAYREIYYQAFPDGRERTVTWPGLVHFKIKPTWIRYNDFSEPKTIKEMSFE